MNHNHRKPYIPLPPALPRFALPNDATDEESGADPLDAAATAQRPALMGTRRRVVRRRRPLAADSTEEVAVEDILLEAYAEDPPPPLSRRMPELPPRTSLASPSAALVPPPPNQQQSAAVDALLRASEPVSRHPLVPLLPVSIAGIPHPAHPPQGQGFVNPYDHAADHESSSVAPVMLATTAPPPSRLVRARPSRRGLQLAVWSAVVLVISVAAGAGVMFGLRSGTFARLLDGARSVATRTPSEPAPVAAAPAQPPPPALTPAPAPAPAPAPVPTISVDSLPKSTIPADVALVTFPAYAHGHRVFVDGRLVTVADGAPTKLKCGRHMIKLGSARKARVVDLACGREVVIQ